MTNRYVKPLVVALMVVMALLGASAALAYGPYTISGTVYLPNGAPAPNVVVELVPHTGLGLDLNNDYWKIPNYQFHRVQTDANGRYVMTGVIDHPENTGHRYALYFDGPSQFYHGTTHVLLKGIETNLTVNLNLTDAAALRVNLTDANGLPFNGTRAVYVETGTLGQGPMVGVSYIIDASFTNGTAVVPRVVIKDNVNGTGLVAILQQPTTTSAWNACFKAGLKPWDNRGALRFAVKQVDGALAEQFVNLQRGSYTPVTFTNVPVN